MSYAEHLSVFLGITLCFILFTFHSDKTRLDIGLLRGSQHCKVLCWGRYGSIFKSSLFGKSAIVGSSPDFTKFLLTNSELFAHGVPPAVVEVVGPKAFLTMEGPHRTHLKKVVTKPVSPEGLRNKIDVLYNIIYEHLASCEQRGTVIAIYAMEEVGC